MSCHVMSCRVDPKNSRRQEHPGGERNGIASHGLVHPPFNIGTVTAEHKQMTTAVAAPPVAPFLLFKILDKADF